MPFNLDEETARLLPFIGLRVVLDVIEPSDPEWTFHPLRGTGIDCQTELDHKGFPYALVRVRVDRPWGRGASAVDRLFLTGRHGGRGFESVLAGGQTVVNVNGEPSERFPTPTFPDHPWGRGYLGFAMLHVDS